MKKVLLGTGLVLLGVMGLFPLSFADDPKATPVIDQSFAAKEIAPDGLWKVYLKASNPEGEMRYIFASIEQPGAGSYPVSIIRVKKENRKQLSGYIYLNTAGVGMEMNSKQLTLSVQIQDRSGQFSAPVVFTLSIRLPASRETPPEGAFQENDLGPIMIRLKPGDGAKGGN